MNQITLYKQIDELFALDLADDAKETAQSLIDISFDARDYFFAEAPIEWISWFYENDFFDILNKKAEDKTRYSFGMPELNYLMRVAEASSHEKELLNVINHVECAKNFNPEVVDRFLWIARKLSVEGLVRIIPKMQRENWGALMRSFKVEGYTYIDIVKKLVDSQEYDSLLILAEAILALNTEERESDYFDKYFYINNVGDSGIFEALADLKGIYAEKAIELITNILSKLATEKVSEENSVFKYKSSFRLYDVDLFTISINSRRHSNDREDLTSLVATLFIVIEKRIGKDCEDDVKEVYDKYIKTLPDAQWMWRIQVFVMNLCQKVFEEDLKKELNKVFNVDRYIEYLSGTEYYQILRLVFPNWSEPEKRQYVKEVLKYFSNKLLDTPEKDWIKGYGWRILSSIESELTDDERSDCEKNFDDAPDPNFETRPSKEIYGGIVKDQSPVDIASGKYKNVSDLIKDLKGQLSPETLQQKDEVDFLNPENAEGVGNEMKEDMKKRMSFYLTHASDFLDPNLHIHYTYSFLRGVESYLRDKQKLSKGDWDNLFDLFNKIKESDKRESPKNNNDDDRWLAKWSWLEKSMANILKSFLTKDYSDLFADKRNLALELLKFLLESEDPKPEDETTKYGDLFHIAINSTRGVAFQALVNFIYLDGEELEKDVADLYRETIEKASLSVAFVIGRYLPSFYSRDKVVVKKMFEIIFPRNDDQYERFFAALEGYLFSPIYKDLFEELEEYYKYALELDPSLYPERHQTGEIDQGIATHLALAFAHFDHIQYTADNKYPLLEMLWSGNDVKKQKEFISFLGRGIISHGDANPEWFKEKNVDLQKLKDFWIWILDDANQFDEEVYANFGFWVNHKTNVFDYDWLVEVVAKTLKRSKGKINWDQGILTRLPKFADIDPKNTLIILEQYLLGEILEDSGRNWFYLDEEKISIFKKLYEAEPSDTTELINKLLEKRGRPFWPLKDIVDA